MIEHLYQKEGWLLLVQVDHLGGELIGSVIDGLYGAGACNVQVISTVTKKNRPGYLFMIDAKEKDVPQIEAIILAEIGATGWHCLKSEHRHVKTEILEKTVEVRAGDQRFDFLLQAKWTPEDEDFYRPEHDCCAALKSRIFEVSGMRIPLKNIYTRVEQAFREKAENTPLTFAKELAKCKTR